jgi:putative ubiquitin-RnfH superfamily antitoxin RatB of RatAB toxin-antitoxin module
MIADSMITVEVAYARPDLQVVIPVEVPEGSSVADALRLSQVSERFPELDLTQVDVGIFGRISRKETILRHRDRVEIYRPLLADPKEVRRRRAAEGKAMKKGGGALE